MLVRHLNNMSLQNNNITITPINNYNPSFNWQVGLSSNNVSANNLLFRATIRPLNGYEQYSRVPSSQVIYEENNIVINSTTNQGFWSFPLNTNASISGGPFRDYQVVIEAHDNNGNTSAGNIIETEGENGWIAFNKGYDVLAISNPRQTGIEMSNNLFTQNASNTGIGDTGYYLHSGNGYQTLNYMGSHGEINIRYLAGNFNSNIAGGYIYAWTGKFPKVDTLLGINGYDSVTKTQFTFDPTIGNVYSPTAAIAFRGANNVYVSLSFYDNLDQIAINSGIDISTGLYISDNAICYNDISAGSISIGGFQSIYSMQYTGNASPTGILGTGAMIIGSQFYNGSTSVLYLANPINISGLSSYSGFQSLVGGGMGGDSILLNNIPLNNVVNSFFLTTSSSTDDSMAIFVNGIPIKDDDNDETDPLVIDVLQYASMSGYSIKMGDIINFYGKDNLLGVWSTVTWQADLTFGDGTISTITGGVNAGGSSDFVPHYRPDGYLIVNKQSISYL